LATIFTQPQDESGCRFPGFHPVPSDVLAKLSLDGKFSPVGAAGTTFDHFPGNR